jgi:hypothetical protein
VKPRFTLDGSAELEERLARICARVEFAVESRVGRNRLEALVLGGGYGRGEGGVLTTNSSDQPFNDLEFYVFLQGNRLWQQHRYGPGLHHLAQSLSDEVGLTVELKIDSAERLRDDSVSMFSYDLLSGHKIIVGGESVFAGCEHHLDAASIPLSEATRLMFNRGSGLLLAREILQRNTLSIEDADFVVRNMAKMKLALGDALLAAFGQYHWSAVERGRRVAVLSAENLPSWLPLVQIHHSAGVAFKLHPWTMREPSQFEIQDGRARTARKAGISCIVPSPCAPRRATDARPNLSADLQSLTELSLQLWLWLESRRLDQHFQSASDYALSAVDKCPGTRVFRNYFLNLRIFGPRAALKGISRRYPRARLFNALALLLWHPEEVTVPRHLHSLQRELQTDAPHWPGLVGAFKQVWPHYG